MSWAFISALKQNPQQSYVQLLNSVRDVLETKYTQKPQLSCSHPLGGLFSLTFISGRSALLTAVISLAARYRSAFCHVRRVSEGVGVVELGGHVRGVGSAMCRSDESDRVRAETAFVLNRRCGDFCLGVREVQIITHAVLVMRIRGQAAPKTQICHQPLSNRLGNRIGFCT
jgi:hypothetical protein